ncbi:MAG: hypothetical protein M3357_05500 [Actinomycetota bacterium]|nr:hypothetical protein [Actinomycetota bacterium]
MTEPGRPPASQIGFPGEDNGLGPVGGLEAGGVTVRATWSAGGEKPEDRLAPVPAPVGEVTQAGGWQGEQPPLNELL